MQVRTVPDAPKAGARPEDIPPAAFYAAILPPDALRCLAVFRQGMKSPPAQTFHTTDVELITAALDADRQECNVFHGCATYATPDNRTGANVAAVRALWVDLDCGEGKPYPNPKEAATALEAFRIAAGLPTPWLVKSGGGMHAYFALDVAVVPENWRRLAALLAACMDHAGVGHDKSVTTDIARILRAPGTHNRKTHDPRAVRILRAGTSAPASSIFRALQDYATAQGVAAPAVAVARASGPAPANELIGTPPTYLPSDASKIATRCPVLAHVDATGGDVSHPVWFSAMGVAKHATDPAGAAERWTRNREATGHTDVDYSARLAAWNVGPTTCNEFAKHCTECAACEHRGTITSPIQLGALSAVEVRALPEVEAAKIEAAAPDWVTSLNERFALVRIGTKLVILDTRSPTQGPAGTRYGVGYLDIEAFRLMHAGAPPVQINGKATNPATAWLSHPLRRQYDGVAFDPNGRVAPQIFNLWRGFAVTPTPGDVTPWLDVLTALVPDASQRAWALRWLAWKTQHPGGVPGTVLILTGAKGTGKNSLLEPFLRIFGPHAGLFDDGEQVVGRFNLHLQSVAFIVLDEALFVGNGAQNDRIKARTTATQISFEGKGLPVIQDVNRAAYVLLTNHADVWAATPDERRPAVIDVGDGLRGMFDTWAAYHAWVNGAGPAALLDYLQRVDLTGFNVREIPRTAGLARQIARTSLQDPAAAWWFGCLDEAAVTTRGGRVELAAGGTEIATATLRESYEAAPRGRHPVEWAVVSKKLREWTGDPRESRPWNKGQVRTRLVHLPTLDEMRQRFTAATGVPFT